MSYLLGTHVFLWALSDPDRIRSEVRALILNPLYPVFISAITAVEISIKQTLGKLQAPNNLEQEIEKRGFRTLALEYRHGARLRHLPHHHQDPFDRILLAQALEESLTLITHDKKLTSYPAKILLTQPPASAPLPTPSTMDMGQSPSSKINRFDPLGWVKTGSAMGLPLGFIDPLHKHE